MKHPIIFCLLLSCCSSSNQTTTSVVSAWSTSSTNNTSKIKVVTHYYNGYDGLHANSIYLLTHLGFEIDHSSNPITTKPKILFNRLVKYYIQCDTAAIVINGEIMESALGGLSNVTPTNFDGKPILRGIDPIGTPWYEKMLVVAEATREGTIYYSD